MGRLSYLPQILQGGAILTESTINNTLRTAKYDALKAFTTTNKGLDGLNSQQQVLRKDGKGHYASQSVPATKNGPDLDAPAKAGKEPPYTYNQKPDKVYPWEYPKDLAMPKGSTFYQPPVDSLPFQYDVVQRFSPLMTLETVKGLQKATFQDEHLVQPGGKTYGHRADSVYSHPKQNPFLPVDYGPWPIVASVGLLTTLLGIVNFLHGAHPEALLCGLGTLIYGLSFWWRDVAREVTFMGWQTLPLQQAYRLGFLLFVGSEILFFFAIFWTWFANASSPMFRVMPDELIIKGWGIPILNTFILLTSGAALTWSHHAMIAATEFAKKTPK